MCSNTHSAWRSERHRLAHLQPALGQRDDLAGLHVAQELRADDVERAGLRGDAVAVAEHPDRQRPQPRRVAEGDDAVLGHHDRRVGALGALHHVGDRVLDRVRLVRREQRRDHLGVRRRAEADALLAQLGVQLDGVDEVAVVGQRDLAPVGAPDGLGVLPRVRAGRRVADVADGHAALERAQLLLVEDLVDEALVAHRHDVAVLGGRDAGGLLAAVLERVEREVGEPGDLLLRREYAEDAALVTGSFAGVEEGVLVHGRRVHGSNATGGRSPSRSVRLASPQRGDDRRRPPSSGGAAVRLTPRQDARRRDDRGSPSPSAVPAAAQEPLPVQKTAAPVLPTSATRHPSPSTASRSSRCPMAADVVVRCLTAGGDRCKGGAAQAVPRHGRLGHGRARALRRTCGIAAGPATRRPDRRAGLPDDVQDVCASTQVRDRRRSSRSAATPARASAVPAESPADGCTGAATVRRSAAAPVRCGPARQPSPSGRTRPRRRDMSVNVPVQIDRQRIRELIEREEKRLNDAHAEVRRDLPARPRGALGRRRLLLPAARPVADLPRARRRPEGLGRRRQRVPRLPQRLRLDGPGPRAPGDRRARSRSATRAAPTSPRRRRTRSSSPRSSSAAGAAWPAGATRTPARSRRWTRSGSRAPTRAATP